MKPKYQQTNLNRVRGRIFVMAYVYMPQGTHLFTGDLETIQKHLRPVSTCHGSVLSYIPRNDKPMFSVEIFGKGGCFEYPRNNNYLSFDHISLFDYHSFRYRELINFLENRKKFILIENTDTGYHVLGKWRRLPKFYLPIFKEYDDSMPVAIDPMLEKEIWRELQLKNRN